MEKLEIRKISPTVGAEVIGFDPNAPLEDHDHARHACLAALDMTRAMGPLNQRLGAEARAEGRKHIALKVGIGLNSGPAVVGNMGSDQRFDYSCLGDTVNTASRLEGQSKGYGVEVVLGPATADAVGDLATIPLDLIKVKGKTQAVKIHALLGDQTMKADPAFETFARTHEAMLAAYWNRQWSAAEEKLESCRQLCRAFADLDGLYGLYAERLRSYAQEPPPADWDGAFVAKTK